MSVETDNSRQAEPKCAERKRAENDKQGKRALHRSDLVTPLFIFSGFGAAYLSGMTIAAAAYTPLGHSAAHLTALYWPAQLYFPCYLVALLRGRWASIPIWLCCVALFVLGFVPAHQPASGISLFRPSAGMILIPALTELARFFRGYTPTKRS
jgi:hypothetical protein